MVQRPEHQGKPGEVKMKKKQSSQSYIVQVGIKTVTLPCSLAKHSTGKQLSKISGHPSLRRFNYRRSFRSRLCNTSYRDKHQLCTKHCFRRACCTDMKSTESHIHIS
uniref:Uncharacterized protein n=1 Tax=Arundo donax TaxID=35708 RepID=A0A0A9I1E6_ARUDO